MIAPTPLLPTPVTDTKWIDHDADHGVRGPIRLSEDPLLKNADVRRPLVWRSRVSLGEVLLLKCCADVHQLLAVRGSGALFRQWHLLPSQSSPHTKLEQRDTLQVRRTPRSAKEQCWTLHVWCTPRMAQEQRRTLLVHRRSNSVSIGAALKVATLAEFDASSTSLQQRCRRRHSTLDGDRS